MSKRTSLIGRTFGSAIVVAEAPDRVSPGGSISPCSELLCGCGKKFTARNPDLVSGKTRSCGCLRRELMRAARTKHGQSHSRTYKSWSCMWQRCTNPKNKDFALYGGRGIMPCDEWRTYEGFFADMGECPEGMELDRIDNNLGYSKANCRWVSQKVSARNRRNTRRFEFMGEFKTAGEWAEKFNLPRRVVTIRLRHGWSLERAFTQPLTR